LCDPGLTHRREIATRTGKTSGVRIDDNPTLREPFFFVCNVYLASRVAVIVPTAVTTIDDFVSSGRLATSPRPNAHCIAQDEEARTASGPVLLDKDPGGAIGKARAGKLEPRQL